MQTCNVILSANYLILFNTTILVYHYISSSVGSVSYHLPLHHLVSYLHHIPEFKTTLHWYSMDVYHYSRQILLEATRLSISDCEVTLGSPHWCLWLFDMGIQANLQWSGTRIPWKCGAQGSFCVCTQSMRDDITMSHRLSLAGRIHKMIPGGNRDMA